MDAKKLFNYYMPYLCTKENLIQKYVVDKSEYFFNKVDNIKDKDIQKFYIQSVCSTMADSYEFFMHLLKSKSYFSRLSTVNDEKGKKIYKLSSMYYTIKFINENESTIENSSYFKNDMFKSFNFCKHEKKSFNRFFTLHQSDPKQFEIDFSKYVVKSIVGNESINSDSLALVTNFFYTSYKNFVVAYNASVASKEVFAS